MTPFDRDHLTAGYRLDGVHALALDAARATFHGIVWAVLDRASRGWRGLTMTPAGLRLLQDLRRSLLEPPRQLRPRPTPTRRTSDRPEPASA